jgi:hypothetical protein
MKKVRKDITVGGGAAAVKKDSKSTAR